MVRSQPPLVERMTLVLHDWFATSNDGVGSARLMLDQNSVFRAHALGSFKHLVHAITHDPAMLLWLDLASQPQGRDQRELRARADGAVHARRRPRGYTERDVRELARSLTGWHTTGATRRRPQLPLRAEPPRPGLQDRVRQERALDWEDGAQGGRAPASTRRSSSEALELLRPDRARRGTAAKLEALYVAPATRSARCSRRSSAPAALRPGRGWSSRRSSTWPGMLRASARGITTTRWPGCARRRPGPLLPAERLGLGRQALARHRDLARALEAVASAILDRTQLDPEHGHEAVDRADEPLAKARRLLARPAVTRRGGAALLDASPAARSPTPRRLEAGALTRALRQNALRQLIAGSPDFQTSEHACPATTAPAPTSSRAAAGRGLPAIEPGMPAPAGTGLTRRSFLARRGLALPVFGGALRCGCSRRASRAAAGPAGPVLVTVFLTGGADSLSLLAPIGDPLLPALRPSSRSPASAATFAEDARLPGTRRRAAAHLHAEGKVSVHAGHRLRRPRPVALHLAPLLGGRRDRPAAAHRAGSGRYLDQSATPTTRCRACRSTGASRRRSPPRSVPVAAVDARRRTASGRPACGARSSTAARRARRARRRVAARRPGDAHRRPARRRRPRLRRSSPPFGTTASARHAAVAYPSTTTPSRRGSPCSPRCSPRVCRSAASRSTPPAATTRTTTRRTPRATTSSSSADVAARVPARPRGARPRRPRARHSSGPSSAAARRRTARGTDHGAAGLRF